MASGIYAITCTVNGHQYVGQSADIDQRWALHRSHLRDGKHHSRYLQRAWSKYGEGAFTFAIVEVTGATQAALNEAEQRFFDLLRPVYNACLTAGSSRGYQHRMDSRKRMSRAKRGIVPLVATLAAAKAARGKPRPQVVRDKISATKRAAGIKRPDLIARNADPAYQARIKAGRDAYWAAHRLAHQQQEGQAS